MSEKNTQSLTLTQKKKGRETVEGINRLVFGECRVHCRLSSLQGSYQSIHKAIASVISVSLPLFNCVYWFTWHWFFPLFFSLARWVSESLVSLCFSFSLWAIAINWPAMPRTGEGREKKERRREGSFSPRARDRVSSFQASERMCLKSLALLIQGNEWPRDRSEEEEEKKEKKVIRVRGESQLCEEPERERWRGQWNVTTYPSTCTYTHYLWR